MEMCGVHSDSCLAQSKEAYFLPRRDCLLGLMGCSFFLESKLKSIPSLMWSRIYFLLMPVSFFCTRYLMVALRKPVTCLNYWQIWSSLLRLTFQRPQINDWFFLKVSKMVRSWQSLKRSGRPFFQSNSSPCDYRQFSMASTVSSSMALMNFSSLVSLPRSSEISSCELLWVDIYNYWPSFRRNHDQYIIYPHHCYSMELTRAFKKIVIAPTPSSRKQLRAQLNTLKRVIQDRLGPAMAASAREHEQQATRSIQLEMHLIRQQKRHLLLQQTAAKCTAEGGPEGRETEIERTREEVRNIRLHLDVLAHKIKDRKQQMSQDQVYLAQLQAEGAHKQETLQRVRKNSDGLKLKIDALDQRIKQKLAGHGFKSSSYSMFCEQLYERKQGLCTQICSKRKKLQQQQSKIAITADQLQRQSRIEAQQQAQLDQLNQKMHAAQFKLAECQRVTKGLHNAVSEQADAKQALAGKLGCLKQRLQAQSQRVESLSLTKQALLEGWAEFQHQNSLLELQLLQYEPAVVLQIEHAQRTVESQ